MVKNMAEKRARLSSEDWIMAGFRALARDGSRALKAEPLARELNTTKGSFYWHFKDLHAYKAAMIETWRAKASNEIIDEVNKQSTPQARLEALFANAGRAAPDAFGGREIEPAMRAWALSDEDVATALAELDTARKAFIARVLSDLRINEPALADLAYGAYIGLDDLQAKGRANIDDALNILRQMILTKAATPSDL